MKQLVETRELLVYTLVMMVLGAIIGFFVGRDIQQSNIKVRALSLKEKKCYTQSDVEYIIFGESQE